MSISNPLPSPEPPLANRGRDRLLAAIFLLLLLYGLVLAQSLVVPLVIALLVSLILAPAVRLLCRSRLPRPLATSIVLGGALLILIGLVGSLLGPAKAWLDDAPRSLARIERAALSLREPLRAAEAAGERLAGLGEDIGPARKSVPTESSESQMSQLLLAAPSALGSVMVTVILIFVFLQHGESLLRKLVELAPALRAKKEIVLAIRSAQRDLSLYMLTITVINLGLGGTTALGLWLLGVPNPLLWGGVTALLNYAPYVGPMLMLLVLTVVGFGEFETVSQALLLPGMFLIFNIIEGQILTPLTVGRRLALDPIVVFLGLVILGWMWGVAGVLLALPLLTCLRILAERVTGWEALAKILRRADPPADEPTPKTVTPALLE